MDRYAIVIPSEGDMVLLHCWPGDGLDLETLQGLVEGPIETVPTGLADGWSLEEGVGLTLIVNEEGKLRGLPINDSATDMAAVLGDTIVGNAVLMGVRGEDFVGLQETAAKIIVRAWG